MNWMQCQNAPDDSYIFLIGFVSFFCEFAYDVHMKMWKKR